MPSSRTLLAVRACDSCRRRKVKCDASVVCANCQISRIPCLYTSVPRKRGPKVARISNIPPDNFEQSLDILATVQHTDETQLPAEESPAPRPVSPVGSHLPENSGLFPASTARSAQATWGRLIRSMHVALPSLILRDAVSHCIDLYIQYVFPAAPSVHEPTLRAAAARFFPDICVTNLFCTQGLQVELGYLRNFALVTALCASIAALMPASLLPYGEAFARPFLTASRDVLKLFEDVDIEQPCSASILIRILQCNALQHTTGRATLANHVLGQASILIRSMRLYSEQALSEFDTLEAQTLRLIYWQMYAADKASACLKSRPYYLHELLYEVEPTTCPRIEVLIPMLDTSKAWYEKEFEERLLIGFHIIPRLWSSAADLVFDMKAYAKGDQASDKTHLTQAYLEFLSIMDGFPTWLQASKIVVSSEDDEMIRPRKVAFWVQRCTILVTFQCLRLVVLRQCILSKVWDVMGLSGQAFTLTMTKVNIVHEFVQTLDDIPFVYLQIKGEPMVQRIRWVGSLLLEILDDANSDAIKVRAEGYFTRLLDLLSRLNSKASETT